MIEVSPRGGTLRYTKLSIRLACAQPPWPDASKLAIRLFNVLTWIFIPFRLLLGITRMNAARYRINDYIVFVKVILLVFSCAREVKALNREAQRAQIESCVKELEDEMFTATPEAAWEYTRMSVFFVFTWPLPLDATKVRKIIFEVCFWISFAVLVVMTLLLFRTVYETLDDYLEFSKAFCVGIACTQVFIKMVICRTQRLRLQTLHRHAENFLTNATPRERAMLQAYTKRCTRLHIFFNAWTIFGTIVMLCGPLILPQTLPMTVTYPFSVEEQPGFAIAYIHEGITGFQCAFNGMIDCHMALLVWLAGARLELLAEEFENATSIREFDRCIKKHQILLTYAEDAVQACRMIVITTICMAGLSAVTAGVQLVSPQPFVVKSQFFVILFCYIYELFLSAWPAENLINACNAVGTGAYKCDWFQDPVQFRQKIFMITLQSRRHCSITLPGLLPELSLSYYATFLSKTYTLFTALRIMFGENED